MLKTDNYALNIAQGTDTVNPLVMDNPNYQKIDKVMKDNEIRGVGTATELKTGPIHAITVQAQYTTFKFVATSDFIRGETFTLNGKQVTAYTTNQSPLDTNAYRIGATVLCSYNERISTITIYTSPIVVNPYPVGSIYISVSETNPGLLFGGIWERIKDRFLLSSGDKYTSVGATGGEETHTLTVDEMPSHYHNAAKYFAQSSGIPGTLQAEADTLYQEKNQITPGYYYNSKSFSTGGSQPHNNMPPYLIVYMWKRTN